jgi:uncharacterized protein (DUF302 family)
MMTYGTSVTLDAPFGRVVAAVRSALGHQGFGVLTEIDVQATMKARLDADTGPYVILGACNPSLAHQALGIDPSLGLLLPCNVVVREAGGSTVVEAVDPEMMMAVSGNPDLKPVAADAAMRLRAALAELTD